MVEMNRKALIKDDRADACLTWLCLNDHIIGPCSSIDDVSRQCFEENGWIDDFKTGDEFETFLEEQDARVADTLKELELL